MPRSGRSSKDLSSSPSNQARSQSGIETLLESEAAVLAARIQTTEDASLGPGAIRLAVGAPNGPFGELTRRGLARNVQNGELLVQLPKEYPSSHDAVAARYRACSYVIDCDALSVKALSAELPATPSVLDLVAFVQRRISVKSLARGFDIASEVAASGEGDCSEHAVLLAALARHHGLAARVVFGLAAVAFESRVPAFIGHAWTEIYDSTRWLLADAALHGIEHQKIPNLVRLHYLPISLLEHEGVDFQAKLLGSPNAFSIHRIQCGR